MNVFSPFRQMETFPQQQQNSEVMYLGTSVNSSEKTKFPCQWTMVLIPFLANQVPGENHPHRRQSNSVGSQHWEERHTCSHQASWGVHLIC